jgi:general stress protein 26
MHDGNQAVRERLWELIKNHRFAMMTTRRDDDALRSRPMTTIEHADDESLWFFAKSDSAVADELGHHPQVGLSYSESSKPDFVSVSGEAAIVTDVEKKRALWNRAVQAWFPEGPEATSVILVQVKPQHAEYWDTHSSKLVQLFSYAKAVASGSPPRDIGEHRDVPLGPRS